MAPRSVLIGRCDPENTKSWLRVHSHRDSPGWLGSTGRGVPHTAANDVSRRCDGNTTQRATRRGPVTLVFFPVGFCSLNSVNWFALFAAVYPESQLDPVLKEQRVLFFFYFTEDPTCSTSLNIAQNTHEDLWKLQRRRVQSSLYALHLLHIHTYAHTHAEISGLCVPSPVRTL